MFKVGGRGIIKMAKLSNKLLKEISQIHDYDPNVQVQKRMAWIQAANNRLKFLNKKWRTSSEIAQYDLMNMQVFYV